MKVECSRDVAEFNRAVGDASKVYSHYASSHGVSITTLNILYSLYTALEPCTQTLLCSQWDLPAQTVNSCLKTLEKNGMIRMEFGAGNRKSKLIRLTPQGEDQADQLIAPLVQAENKTFQTLKPEERRLYLEITRKYTAVLREILQMP